MTYIKFILSKVIEQGYYFSNEFLNQETLFFLEKEIDSLPLERGDHINFPINKGKPNEVKQFHERGYYSLDDIHVPIASKLCYDLSKNFNIENWLPNEIGYQQYTENDWISPHRDRKTDKLFSVTITIIGSCIINLYNPKKEYDDYSNLEKFNSIITKPGTIMFLRAPGLGNGKQIIHEVMPPTTKKRKILNLRMRDTILKQPKNYYD